MVWLTNFLKRCQPWVAFTCCSYLTLEQPRAMAVYYLCYLKLPRVMGVIGERWFVNWLWPFSRTIDSASELSQLERIQLQLNVFMVLAYSPIHFLSLILSLKLGWSSSFQLQSSGMSFWMLTSLQSGLPSLQLKVTSWGGAECGAFHLCQSAMSWLQQTMLLLGKSSSSLFLSPQMLANLAVMKESQIRRWSEENYCGRGTGLFYQRSWDLKALLSVNLDRVSAYRFEEGLALKGLVDQRMWWMLSSLCLLSFLGQVLVLLDFGVSWTLELVACSVLAFTCSEWGLGVRLIFFLSGVQCWVDL